MLPGGAINVLPDGALSELPRSVPRNAPNKNDLDSQFLPVKPKEHTH